MTLHLSSSLFGLFFFHIEGNVASGVQGIGGVSLHVGFLLICHSTGLLLLKQCLIICLLRNQCTNSVSVKIMARSYPSQLLCKKNQMSGKSWGFADHN